MSHISIRDLQKLSKRSIAALHGTILVKSGNEAVALLTPLVRSSEERRAAAERGAKLAEELRSRRDPAEDDAFFAANPDLDPTDWTEEYIRAFLAERRKS